MKIKIYFWHHILRKKIQNPPCQDRFTALQRTRLIYQFWVQRWQTHEFVQEF